MKYKIEGTRFEIDTDSTVDITCTECNGDGYDLDGCTDDDNFDDCPECGGTGTTTGEDWYGPTV